MKTWTYRNGRRVNKPIDRERTMPQTETADGPDTTNRFLVGVNVARDQIQILKPVPEYMSRDDALNLAAWLAALADLSDGGRFDDLLRAVRTS